ncbi:MAG: Xaa-Pro peptidase family protein [Solirubrobacterales bacterium]
MSVFSERADRLEWLAQQEQLDLLLVTNLTNVHYLTGFAGTNGLCIVGSGKRVFVTDFRYTARAENEVRDWELHEGKRDLLESVVEVAIAESEEGPVRLGFDDAHMSVRQHARLAGLAGDEVELVAAAGLVEKLREVKDAKEIEAIRAATSLADDLYRWLIAEHGLAGHTERAVAIALERRALDMGTSMSFPPIVAAAENAALPHAEPRDAEIPRDTLVVVDMGCTRDGYCSDCTRTFATGEIGGEAQGCYELVKQAQAAALERARAGAAAQEVDAAAREIIGRAGHGEHFGHGVGHGVGLEVHEGPRLAPGTKSLLAEGNIVTIEPGVYLPGRFGARIEDLVVVRDDEPEVLTGVSKDLTIV